MIWSANSRLRGADQEHRKPLLYSCADLYALPIRKDRHNLRAVDASLMCLITGRLKAAFLCHLRWSPTAVQCRTCQHCKPTPLHAEGRALTRMCTSISSINQFGRTAHNLYCNHKHAISRFAGVFCRRPTSWELEREQVTWKPCFIPVDRPKPNSIRYIIIRSDK